jgi:hypothetical protein
VDPEVSLPHSKKLTNCPYPKLDDDDDNNNNNNNHNNNKTPWSRV